MKKRLILLLLLTGLPASAARAEDSPSADVGAVHESPLRKNSLYSISSDELDASESLNRVAGSIDLGFADPSQTYKSSDHYSPGPFSREKAVESS